MRLAQFIRSEMQAILAEWDAFARSIEPGGKAIHELDLRNDAERLLRSIADDVDSAQSAAQQTAKSRGGVAVSTQGIDPSATTHAEQRIQVGMDIDQLIAEYRALRASVLRLWRGQLQMADPKDLDDVTRFNEAIDQAMTRSVSEFTANVDYFKDLFLGMVSHEMRGPLHAVLLQATLLTQSPELDEKYSQSRRPYLAKCDAHEPPVT